MPRFYLDILDDNQVIQDLEGIDFADRETAIVEAAQGARDLVAHGIMQNEGAPPYFARGRVLRLEDRQLGLAC